jgi:flagellin
MAIVINTNINALRAQSYLEKSQDGYAKALTRLSSGLRVNDASDDPAGLAIATNMRLTSYALRQGARNGNDGISLVQTAQTAMTSVLNLLSRMSEIASQASSGTYTSSNLSNLGTEFNSLLTEVNRVSLTTQFNGLSLLQNATGSISIQIGSGSTTNDQLSVTLANTTIGSAGLNISSVSVSTNANAQAAIGTLSTAIQTVTTGLAALGANQSNLKAAVSNNIAIATDLDAAKSRIMDADFGEESTNLAKFNILLQSGIAMLSQANSSPQAVLQLLRS